MVESYAKSLRQQRLGFIVCLVIWGIVVSMALLGLFWEWKGREWWVRRGWEGGEGGGGRRAPDGMWKGGGMNEKGDLKPSHLRADSLSNSRAASPEPPLRPPRPLGDSPPHSATPSTSSTTWGFLIDCFRPTTTTSYPSPGAHEMKETPSRRPFALLKPPTLPRLPKPLFPSWELPSAPSYPSRLAPRRNSDQLDLRSGELVGHSYPQGGTRRVASGRMALKGAAGRLAVTMRGMKRGGDGVRKRRSARKSPLTSFS